MDKNILYKYTVKEDIYNAISHGIGVIVGILVLITLSYISSDMTELVVGSLYSLVFITMFLCSTIYHSIFIDSARSVFKRLDHCSIFLLITATYAPYTFLCLNTTKSYIIYAVLVVLTIAGIVIKTLYISKFKKTATLIYVLMGWAVVFQIPDLIKYVSSESIFYLALGGVVYTIGAVFYAFAKFKYHHFVWHLFVLAAALLHFYSIYLIFVK